MVRGGFTKEPLELPEGQTEAGLVGWRWERASASLGHRWERSMFREGERIPGGGLPDIPGTDWLRPHEE